MKSYDTELLAQKVRQEVLRMVYTARASHIGSALSIVDILSVLYGRVMRYDVTNPRERTRDRLILSKGHACVALYATLSEVGFFDKRLLDTYGQNGSVLMNHASHHVPGVEFSSGSLGHGLSFGAGKALCAKLTNQRYRVFVVASDGELNEGSNWEAIMFASHHRLSNLTLIIDHNGLQSLGTTTETLNLEPLADKFKSFGWNPLTINGHSHSELNHSIQNESSGMPTVVICRTIKGYGVSFMENQVKWHYKNPDKEEFQLAMRELLGHKYL